MAAQKSRNKRKPAGGAATGGGMNFQAAVTAIAFVHMARGCALGWLHGLVNDIPVAIDAETAGPGDDIRLILADGQTVEIQAKKGLRATSELWDAILSLARGVTKDAIDFGVLAVSSTSSGTITKDLARDLLRIGEGRTDDLSDIATTLNTKLRSAGIDPVAACARLRIQTVHALDADQASIAAAKAELAHLLEAKSQVAAAWKVLLTDASSLIERRGRRDVAGLLPALRSVGIQTASASPDPLALLDRLTRWTREVNASFTIVGVQEPLSVDDAWISLTATVRDNVGDEEDSLEEALRKYQAWESRTATRERQSVDPETLGRFVLKAVLVAGPGMGKSTLLRRIARRYSEDGIPILKVRLSEVAKRLHAGETFEEAVFSLGLDSSRITPFQARAAGFRNWLLLCDGLDECGSLQDRVAEGVARFATGYSESRILVTTRPVGYRAAHFHDWRHYDLPALSYSSAYSNAAKLLDAIGSVNLAREEDVWDLCRRELHDTPAARIVGRTPLMLSLAVSILARGRTLPDSRERLYEEIFRLIDEAPNTRTPEPPATGEVLRRFLDMLGWTLTEQPLDGIEALVTRCATWLVGELGIAPLAATEKAELYLNYWENVGIVERVGHGDRKALSFIHKTFGEFTAARHLRALSALERATALSQILGDPAWAEVLRFAALLGLADEVASQLISGPLGPNELTLAVELLADGIPPPNQPTRTSIINGTVEVITGDRPIRAYGIGNHMVRAASRYPDEIAPALAYARSSRQPWTRLIAWACTVAGGKNHFTLEDLMAALPEVVASLEPSIRRAVGGLSLGGGPDRPIAEAFVLAACEQILERAAPDVADTLVQPALSAEQLGSVGFLKKANHLVQANGRTYTVGAQPSMPPNLFAFPEGFFDAVLAMWNAIFEAIDLPPNDGTIVASTEQPLLHISALYEASKMTDVAVSDVWNWTHPFRKDAFRETLRVFLGVIDIDVERLREEAMQARAYLLTDEERQDVSIFAITTEVDPPPAVWSRAKTLGADPTLIEAAVHHRSHWVQWMATNTLAALLPQDELEAAADRLLETGRETTLWAASALASRLTPDRATSLVLRRLANPLVPGCCHLFRLLEKIRAEPSPDLAAALRAGLFADDVDTAVEAAKLVMTLGIASVPELAETLEAAHAHWLLHEQPYPKRGGVVPTSPRAEILKALGQFRAWTYVRLKDLLADARPDVTEFAKSALERRMQTPEGERLELLADVAAGELGADRLRELLKRGVELDDKELLAAEALLKHESEVVRFNAMSLLDERYLDKDRIKMLALHLSKDENDEIKERACSILESS